MNKGNWAKNKPRVTVTIDKEAHDLLVDLALKCKVCLKDMVSIALVAYALLKDKENV